MDGSERTLTVEYTWKLWSPESVCRTYDIAHRLHDRTTASTAYLSPKDARLFPKPNDGQHPQEQGVEVSSCLSLTSIRNLGKRHCSIRKPCYMLHQNDRQPFIEPNQMRTPLSRQLRETSLCNEQIQLWTVASADGSGMYRSGTGLEFGQRSLSCGRTTSGEVAFTNNHTPTRHLPSLQRPS